MSVSKSLHSKQARLRLQRTRKMLHLFFGILILIGFYYVKSIDSLVGFLLICFAVYWPLKLWSQMSRSEIPILPVVALIHLQYYAIPILRHNYDIYDYDARNVLIAAISVSLYIVVVTAAWKFIITRTRKSPAKILAYTNSIQDNRLMVSFGLAGLWLGLLFQLLVFHGLFAWAGSAYGVIRAVAYSLTSMSCFVLGVAWGRGVLNSSQKQLCCILFGCGLLLIWTSLFLVFGIVLLATGMIGFFLASRRVPAVFAVSMVIAVFLLHAGKSEMRDRYWHGQATIRSVTKIPSFYLEWGSSGISSLVSGSKQQSVFDRASLLEMLLFAQAKTPEKYNYLYGKTYAVLPALLVPRFLWADKPVSQAAMNMLNVRYGLIQLDKRGNVKTAIGWGVIAEGYVNFGMFGIVGIGLVMGGLMGLLTRWSSNKSEVSLPTLYAIVSMVAFISLETDFTYLCTILFQSFFAVFIYLYLLNFFLNKGRARR